VSPTCGGAAAVTDRDGLPDEDQDTDDPQVAAGWIDTYGQLIDRARILAVTGGSAKAARWRDEMERLKRRRSFWIRRYKELRLGLSPG